MYDAWAVFDDVAEPFFLGKTVHGFSCPFDGIAPPADLKAAREEAISYAMFRILSHRFQNAPSATAIKAELDQLMDDLGYDRSFTSLDYSTGSPAALGNYIADEIIQFGLQDGANEANTYANEYYTPVNSPLVTDLPGNPDIEDLNRWQPLTLDVFIDQSGNVIPLSTPDFLSPEWGKVVPFSLSEDDLTIYNRDGGEYWVYHDPGPPPMLDLIDGGGTSDQYKWNFELVSVWSAQLDPNDDVMWDISPASIGNVPALPETFEETQAFYDLENGGDASIGRDLNPYTGAPYEPQMVPRGDYARVLAEFWADGPDSETPPGHWFTLLNYVNDHPLFEKRFAGQGPILDDLEWDVKAYFIMGGTMHDVAVTSWGIKGWYDYIRPISAIRGMAEKGQSSDPDLPSYHVGGIQLIPGYIELITADDPTPLTGSSDQHVGKIKVKAWRGPDFIINPDTDEAGVTWIRAENWWPYQRPSFVTPPFAGYVSGHSTYSRAAAEVMTLLTGDAYFPGGMGAFHANMNEFLVFEDGPSQDIVLQWATYRDASDQCSLSRIWGGIHPPADDIPGRKIGLEIGPEAFRFAERYFYKDIDMDGYYNNVDCDDNDNTVYPGAAEICDGKDNDCNDLIDDGLTIYTYYQDQDGDTYGNAAISLDTCQSFAPTGYVVNDQDCDDNNGAINPGASELCDGIDNNCAGGIDDGLTLYTYYRDQDGDTFGDAANTMETCQNAAPTGYATNNLDCDDNNSAINPDASEICDGIDNDCNNAIDDGLTEYTYYRDQDNDDFGDADNSLSSCQIIAPTGYVANNLDCDDNNEAINPVASEICDGIDNDCAGGIDDGLTIYVYYLDQDNDSFGNINISLETCEDVPPAGYVANDQDCDDNNSGIHPSALDIADNGIDEDCTGYDLFQQTKVFPNPVRNILTIHYAFEGNLRVQLIDASGRFIRNELVAFVDNQATISCAALAQGVYILRLADSNGEQLLVEKIFR
ncbi:MAG: hypothetical protein DHS20C18_30540 [Saprospiraceae bacterium]|nr:MAG: hypothetical protein DHS20C18_30540 [Saprospiraceae bacterium]